MKHDGDIIGSVHIIEQAVVDEWGLNRVALRGRVQQRDYTRARHAIIYLALQLLPGATQPSLARALDRDHTTIGYARENIQRLRAREPVFAKRLDQLKQNLVPLLAAPRASNERLSLHLAREIGREVGRGIGDEIGRRVALALQPAILKQLTGNEGDAS